MIKIKFLPVIEIWYKYLICSRILISIVLVAKAWLFKVRFIKEKAVLSKAASVIQRSTVHSPYFRITVRLRLL